MPVETTAVDVARYLHDEESQAEFITLALDEGDPAEIARALGIVARARGMAAVAREAGVAREALYKSLSGESDIRLSTLLGVARALGFSLVAKPKAAGA